MDVVALFYNRLDEARKTKGTFSFLIANGVGNRKAQSINGSVNQNRVIHRLPPAWSIIELEWLFSEDEMIDLLEAKLRDNKSDKEVMLIWEYFRTELSEKGRQKALLYRQMFKRYCLEQAMLKEGIG